MKNRLPITFILITVALDSMGFGLIMPVMPSLIQELSGSNISNAALWGGILATAFAIMQFLFGPMVGNLSDRFGRRPVLMIALFIMSLDYLVMAVAGTMWLLLVGRIVGGITAATQSTAAAYMADISTPKEKAANFGLIGAAFGVGFILGPLLGAALAELGSRAPFYAAAALAAANLAFGYFVLPETVTDRIRRPFEWRRANPLSAFKNIGSLPGLTPLMVITFIYNVGFFVYPAIWAYFAIERFGWGTGMIGLSLGMFGLSMALVQGVLIRPILRILGDRNTVIFGLLVDVFAFTFLGFVSNGWVALAVLPITAFGSVAGPAISGLMSRSARDDQQGELQGTLASIGAVSMIVAPILMTRTFWYFTSSDAPTYLPGAPFLLSALLTLICVVVFVRTRPQNAGG
ncbi:MAG: TCR/Tet family MFS transporter [Rhodobacteraceae bacterium]|nr:TCR/Tet family MFS transporter [Paracoccaceae bacterium]